MLERLKKFWSETPIMDMPLWVRLAIPVVFFGSIAVLAVLFGAYVLPSVFHFVK